MGRFLKRMKRKRKLRADRLDRKMEAKQGMIEQRQMAKLSKKQAKKLGKIYGDLNPEEVNQMNEVQPYVGAMAEQLQEQGVEVQNPDDPIEVTAAYNREILGEEMPEGTDAESFENFLSNKENLDEGRKKKIGSFFKTAFGAIKGAFNARKDEAKEKAKRGEELNKTDKMVLDVNNAANSEIEKEKKKQIGGALKSILPFAIVGFVLYMIFK